MAACFNLETAVIACFYAEHHLLHDYVKMLLAAVQDCRTLAAASCMHF